MRKIKYRGIPTDNNISYDKEDGFAEGSLIIDNDKYYIVLEVIDNIKRDDYAIYMIEVIPETVGQYTGLKDKNGKEIYEGDILTIPEWLINDNQEVCVCIYDQENTVSDIIGFGLYTKDGYSGKYKILVYSDEWDEFEVIGNMYDNPELLGGNNGD